MMYWTIFLSPSSSSFTRPPASSSQATITPPTPLHPSDDEHCGPREERGSVCVWRWQKYPSVLSNDPDLEQCDSMFNSSHPFLICGMSRGGLKLQTKPPLSCSFQTDTSQMAAILDDQTQRLWHAALKLHLVPTRHWLNTRQRRNTTNDRDPISKVLAIRVQFWQKGLWSHEKWTLMLWQIAFGH